MSLIILTVSVLVLSWLVARAANWLPAHYAQEESAWLSSIRSHNSADIDDLDYQPLTGSALCRSFLGSVPPVNWLTFASILGVIGVAAWVWIAQSAQLSMFCWLIFGSGLVLLALVDLQIKLLPDALTLPLLWLGLAIQLLPETRTVGLEMAVIGAIAGYLPLWLLAQAYRLLRGRDGLGMGDLKLLAAMGAWSGPFVLPQVILLAALLAIAVFVLERVLRRSNGGIHEERPFGPAIVAAYFIVLVFTH